MRCPGTHLSNKNYYHLSREIRVRATPVSTARIQAMRMLPGQTSAGAEACRRLIYAAAATDSAGATGYKV
jgi:hypothetical protein